MLESTRNRSSLGRLTRTVGPVIAGATVCLTLGNNGATPPVGDAPTQFFDMQAGPVEDLERDLRCLLRRLMGLDCEEDETEEPPSPTEPVGQIRLI